MNRGDLSKKEPIHPDMTVLDIVVGFKETLDVFKEYDKKVGECICCNALFLPLRELADKYNLSLEKLLYKLNAAIN